jgi:hypothetical protein
VASLTMQSIYLVSWRGWNNCGIECGVPGRYCVQLRATCPDGLVIGAVDAPLTCCSLNGPSAQCKPCQTHKGSCKLLVSLVQGGL